MLTNYETRLLQKEHSGCAALLRDDKVGRNGLTGAGAAGAIATGASSLLSVVATHGEGGKAE